MRPLLLALAAACTLAPAPALAWGQRAHAVIDRAALAALPADGPLFLRDHADYIAESATVPDSWRGDSEPFSKIEEDPNHGWFKEQFAFLKPIPRSRFAFILALYDEYLRIKDSDPARASLTNVRWTGTLPYAAMESYGRLVAGMRQVRAARAEGKDASVAEQNCANQVVRLGHYIGDGAQPLHDTVNHDGWRLPDNPGGYTTDPSVHGRFESQFVDAIALEPGDIAGRIAAIGHQQGDLFEAVLAFLDQSAGQQERVYILEKRDGFKNPQDKDVRELVYARTAAGAAMLRDMIQRAWVESAAPPARSNPSPIDSRNPRYDPATGSAPPQQARPDF